MYKIFKATFFILLMMNLWAGTVSAYDEVIPVEMEGNEAVVTFLEGSAVVCTESGTTSSPLILHAKLQNGDRVTTGHETRIELTFTDGSLLRFDEETTFEIININYSMETKKRDINVKMVLGRTWANVCSVVGKKGGLSLHAKNAVAGVRGTVYRMNVAKDNSTIVKVYSGEVTVQKPSQIAGQTPSKVESPYPVPGPHPVPGPKKVSMEEWTYIVRAMQQIVIKPDGTVEEPTTFSAQADSNEWVQWNQKRDQ